MCIRQILQALQINQLRQLLPGPSMQADVDWRRKFDILRHFLPFRREHKIRERGLGR
jgi:hypothetical protein